MKVRDLRGQKFGKLTVVRPIQAWVCQCECGRFKRILAAYLVQNKNLACGECASKERADKRRTHGLSNTRAYAAWVQAKNRCGNPKFIYYENYGGRGITMCDRWRDSFENFYADMGERPVGFSLDRIDNDGNYEPDNCRWADKHTQARNRSDNRWIEYLGIKKIAADWAYSLGVTQRVFDRTIKRDGIEEGIAQIVLLKVAGLERGGPGPSGYILTGSSGGK